MRWPGRDTPADADDSSDVDGSPERPEVVKPTAMLRREQQIGYVLAGVAGAGSLSVATSGGNNLLFGALGLVATAILVVAIRHGHRVVTALAGFLTGLAFFYIFPLELAFLVFSGYLTMRTSNAQAKLRRSQPAMTAAERRAAAQARAAARGRRRKGETQEVAAVNTPAANRRYTPPKAKSTRRR